MRWKGILFVPRALVVGGVLLGGVMPIAAATQSWTGSVSPFWIDAGNWQSGVAPVAGDNLQFTLGNLSNRSNYNNFASGTTFGSISIFEGSMVGYTLAGASITLTNGISASGAATSLAPVFDLDINLNQPIETFSASRSLVFNGNIVLNTGFSTVYLFLGGAGTMVFNGTITGGSGSILKTNSGSMILSSGASFQGDAIHLSGGSFQLDGAVTNASSSCFVYVDSPATLLGTGVVDTVQFQGGGTLSPGDGEPGVLQCKSADVSVGTLLARINGPILGTGYSQLLVSSNCILDRLARCGAPGNQAQLGIALGYAPQLGDSFQIIQILQGPEFGSFTNLQYDSIADTTNGYSFGVSYTNGVNLTTVRRPDSPFVLWTGNASYYPHITNVAWSSANNWAAAVGPTTGSRLRFTHFQNRTCDGYNPPPQTNDLAAGFSLASLLFTETNYVIYGNAITVTEGITNRIAQGTNWCYLALVTTGPLVFDGDVGGTLVVSNSISGSGTVRKEGGGRLLYTGTTMNSFVGSVVVDSGVFLADGSFTDGSFAVNGGLLTGTGTVSSVTMNGGTLLPGASPGILHVQGNVTMSPGAVFRLELNGPTPGNGYDQLEVNGAVNLAGATLNVQPGFSITPGTAFLVLVNDSANRMSGTFAGLPEGATFPASGQYFSISYKAGPRSNDVLLTRVNPPGNLSGIMLVNAGTVQLQGSGVSNVAYSIEANTNLTTTNWVNIGAATGGSSGVFFFNVTNLPSFPQRFFRLQTP